MASAVAPPTTPKTTTSVDPLYTAAVAQAKAALAAETAPIQGEQAASDASYQQRQTDATGVAAALSKLLQPIGPAVSGMYETAAQNQELAANGFSQGMQDALKGNTDNLNAMLQKLGSPATLDSHASQAGDALYGVGGYNPGTAFSQEGAAFGSAATLQAGDAILKGQENVKDLQGKAIVADQGFQAKIAEMAGKLPGDVQTNYQHLQTLSLQDAKFREQVRKDNIDVAMKQADQKLALAKYSTGISEFNARQQQQLSIASARLAQQKVISDRSYGLAFAKFGIEQQRLQQTILSNSFKAANGGLTKQQVGKFQSVAQASAMKSFYGSTKVTTQSGAPTSTANVGRVQYSEALQNILQKGVPVQLALDALDRVYPAAQRPTDQILAQVLGPLDPALLKQAANETAQTSSNYAQTTGQIPGLEALSRKYGVDPSALMAVAAQEGLGGGVGDSGTSFGPFQLHVGGALPASIATLGPTKAQQWAWSPAGIEYAVSRIATVARGLTGQQAINAIVTRFERPANPGSEVAGASSYYRGG